MTQLRATETSAGVRDPRARSLLVLDAALTGLNGAAYLLAAGPLADFFGAGRGLLIELGVFLLVVAVAVALLARSQPISRFGLGALAALNLGWVVASVGYAVTADLSALGVVWVLVQAALVGGFAAVQLRLVRDR